MELWEIKLKYHIPNEILGLCFNRMGGTVSNLRNISAANFILKHSDDNYTLFAFSIMKLEIQKFNYYGEHLPTLARRVETKITNGCQRIINKQT